MVIFLPECQNSCRDNPLSIFIHIIFSYMTLSQLLANRMLKLPSFQSFTSSAHRIMWRRICYGSESVSWGAFWKKRSSTCWIICVLLISQYFDPCFSNTRKPLLCLKKCFHERTNLVWLRILTGLFPLYSCFEASWKKRHYFLILYCKISSVESAPKLCRKDANFLRHENKLLTRNQCKWSDCHQLFYGQKFHLKRCRHYGIWTLY